MLRISSVWISLLLFTLPIVASQSLGLWLAKPLANYLLEQKVAEIKQALEERHKELDTALTEQLAQFDFDCGPTDMALLRDPRY